ncbi:MAG: biopolymer transporter ExbD [Planctomycetota bacterium]
MRTARRESMKDMKISLTSLLDLVFNFLAFFVITYTPPLATKSYQVSLPPPKVGNAQQGVGAATTIDSDEEPEVFQDVTLGLESDSSGSLSGLRLEGRLIQNSNDQRILERDLRVLLGSFRGAGQSLEVINIVSPPELKYSFLIDVVDACQRAGFKKINFAEAPSSN